MLKSRILLSRLPQTFKPRTSTSLIKKTPIAHFHNMSLFPRFSASNDFGPIFRLLDDYDTHRSRSGPSHSAVRAFQPKFDVRELASSYELHGELPGIDQKDISIEFSDPHTIVISGRTVRESTQSSDNDATSGKPIEDKKARVEDEDAADGNEKTSAVTKKQDAEVEDQPTYWVSERSVGEFHRQFGFPSRVDQDHVKASLKNGILNIVVPKAQAQQARKISIE